MVARLSGHLTDLGAQVEVFCMDRTIDRRICSETLDSSLIVHRYRPDLPSHRFPMSLALTAEVRRRARDFDIVHAHSFHSSLPLLVSLATDRPFIFTPYFHGVGHSRAAAALHLVYDPAARYIFRRSSSTICISHAEASLLQQWYKSAAEKIVVLPAGVDMIDFSGVEPFEQPGRVLLTGGRLESYKHIDKVIAAMQYLPEDFSLVVTGEGPDRHRLEVETSLRGLQERVLFTGSVSDAVLRRWQRTADVVVSASTQESFGLHVVEGIYAGAGVVASDIPSHRELLTPVGSWARLVPTDTTGSQLAEAIRQCHGRPVPPEVAQRIGLKDWVDVARCTWLIYQQAISGRAL